MTITNPVYLLPMLDTPLKTNAADTLVGVLEHVAANTPMVLGDADERRMTLYYSALADLASTHDGAAQQQIYEAYATTLPTGKTLNNATAQEVRRTTLAFHGLARDRVKKRFGAGTLTTWLAAADEALATYRRALATAA